MSCFATLQASGLPPAAPSVAASQEAKNEILIDSYNAVRSGRITDPETIRELARRFSEIEHDPEANKNVLFDAGKAASILLRQAKLYEDQARAGHIYNANAQAGMP